MCTQRAFHAQTSRQVHFIISLCDKVCWSGKTLQYFAEVVSPAANSCSQHSVLFTSKVGCAISMISCAWFWACLWTSRKRHGRTFCVYRRVQWLLEHAVTCTQVIQAVLRCAGSSLGPLGITGPSHTWETGRPGIFRHIWRLIILTIWRR